MTSQLCKDMRICYILARFIRSANLSNDFAHLSNPKGSISLKVILIKTLNLKQFIDNPNTPNKPNTYLILVFPLLVYYTYMMIKQNLFRKKLLGFFLLWENSSEISNRKNNFTICITGDKNNYSLLTIHIKKSEFHSH